MRTIQRAMIVAILLAAWPALGADAPVGKWNTVDDKSGKVVSEVEVYEQGGKLFGKIVGLTEPNDKDGKPKVCITCGGEEERYPPRAGHAEARR